MSEHRPPRYRHDYAALAKLIHEPCRDWPRCRCGQKWPEWDAQVEEWIDPALPPATEDEIAAALMAIVCMLSCASVHAPDKRVRMAAKLQLAEPLFAAVVAGAEPRDVIAEAMRSARVGASTDLSHPKTELLSQSQGDGDAHSDAPYEPPLDKTMVGMWAKGEEARRLGEIAEKRKSLRIAKQGDQ